MNITAEHYGQSVIVAFGGEFTADTVDAVKAVVDHQLDEPNVRDVVVNLEAVPFVDSAALEYLLDLQEKLAERLGQVKLIRPDENVQKILEVTRLENAFARFDDANAAVKTV